MQNETVKIDTKQVLTRTNYTTDCLRKVKDPETGVVEVKRWVEQRVAGANLQIIESLKAVFHNGARIA